LVSGLDFCSIKENRSQGKGRNFLHPDLSFDRGFPENPRKRDLPRKIKGKEKPAKCGNLVSAVADSPSPFQSHFDEAKTSGG
jgi:hypothetical protein